jgi:hypothetical protein
MFSSGSPYGIIMCRETLWKTEQQRVKRVTKRRVRGWLQSTYFSFLISHTLERTGIFPASFPHLFPKGGQAPVCEIICKSMKEVVKLLLSHVTPVGGKFTLKTSN